MKTPYITDETPYRAICAGVQSTHKTATLAATWAQAQLNEWAQLGYRRSAKVYYRDGSLILTLGSLA